MESRILESDSTTGKTAKSGRDVQHVVAVVILTVTILIIVWYVATGGASVGATQGAWDSFQDDSLVWGSSASSDQKTCYSNQRTICGAANTMEAEDGNLNALTTTAVSQLVPKYLKTSPKCPATGLDYRFATTATSTVDPCSEHGSF